MWVLAGELEKLQARPDRSSFGAPFDLFDEAANSRPLDLRENSSGNLFTVDAVAVGCHRNVHVNSDVVVQCDKVMLTEPKILLEMVAQRDDFMGKTDVIARPCRNSR